MKQFRRLWFQRGFGFLIVMPQIVLLGVFAAIATASVRHEVSAANVQIKRLQAELAADGSVQAAIFDKLVGRAWKATAKEGHDVLVPVSISVEREAGKVSVLRRPNPYLDRLIELACIPEQDRGLLRRWFAKREDPKQPDGGVITSIKLDTLSDVRRQSGTSISSFLTLRPHITNRNNSERPDLAAASEIVVKAVAGDVKVSVPLADQPAKPVADQNDNAGILTFIAVTEPGAPAAFRERAVVYLSGGKNYPYRILEVATDELDIEKADCRLEKRIK